MNEMRTKATEVFPVATNGSAATTEVLTVEEKRQTKLLENGLVMADRFINKNYLINLQERSVVPLEQELKITKAIRLYKVSKLVYDAKENINDKLISVYSALQDIGGTALMIVDSDGAKVSYYIGTRTAENAATAGKILQKSFMGNFPGSTLINLKNSEISGVMNRVTESAYENTSRNVAEVTVVPSMRDEDKDKFVQGIEKFIDTMQGEKYTAYFIAQPVSKAELETRKRGYEELYSALSPFAKTNLSYGENFSRAVSKGMFENFSHSVNNSLTNTSGENTSTSHSYTSGTSSNDGINVQGFSTSWGSSQSSTEGYSAGKSWSKSVTSGSADTTGTGINEGESETSGNSRTLSIEYQNKSVNVILENIEKQLERIKMCEAFGLWNCAGYFVADDIQTAVVAANTYKALMLGDETYVDNSFVNVWGLKNPEMTERVLEYIKYGIQPLITIQPEDGFPALDVTPGNYISGKELPLMMGIPHKSVTGLTVSSIAEFGRNVFSQKEKPNARKIQLGRIHHMGNTEKTFVNLDLDSLNSHCFVTGSTGSGKSNTTYCLLERFLQNNIPFLVVEPAKGEYKTEFGAVEGMHVFTTNPLIGQMLKLNPFRFDPKIHILEHLDRLIEIFNACWEMYAAMPAILKDAVEKVYIMKGWDLLNSQYMRPGVPEYPTFMDLLETLPKVISSSSYSSDTKGDYTGALVTRVASLSNGITGQIFCDNYDISDQVLFDECTIVDLSRVGSSETKSLIMGILVLKLTEYRMANANGANKGLCHVTVLEEAHNLLKRTSGTGAAGSDVIGKSVEMICNNIAEMRTYGEGFIIVDQSPTAVDIAAIKNTNTKIVMRLPEQSDCEAVANAMGLDENQTKEITKLSTGCAIVMQNNWLEPVLTQIDAYSGHHEKAFPMLDFAEVRHLRSVVAEEFVNQYLKERKMNLERMLQCIAQTDASPEKKEEMVCCMTYVVGCLAKGRDIDFFGRSLMNLLCCKNVFDLAEKKIKTEKIENSKKRRITMESAKEWKTEFLSLFKHYCDSDEKFCKLCMKYLLYSQSFKETAISYKELYDLLYHKK